MTEHHGAQHHVFGQFVCLRLDHQHRLLRAGDDQIELARFEFGRGRIEHILAVGIAHARSADRPLNGMPETASAAEAPIIAGMSESTSLFDDMTVATTCTSL